MGKGKGECGRSVGTQQPSGQREYEGRVDHTPDVAAYERAWLSERGGSAKPPLFQCVSIHPLATRRLQPCRARGTVLAVRAHIRYIVTSAGALYAQCLAHAGSTAPCAKTHFIASRHKQTCTHSQQAANGSLICLLQQGKKRLELLHTYTPQVTGHKHHGGRYLADANYTNLTCRRFRIGMGGRASRDSVRVTSERGIEGNRRQIEGGIEEGQSEVARLRGATDRPNSVHEARNSNRIDADRSTETRREEDRTEW